MDLISSLYLQYLKYFLKDKKRKKKIKQKKHLSIYKNNYFFFSF